MTGEKSNPSTIIPKEHCRPHRRGGNLKRGLEEITNGGGKVSGKDSLEEGPKNGGLYKYNVRPNDG